MENIILSPQIVSSTKPADRLAGVLLGVEIARLGLKIVEKLGWRKEEGEGGTYVFFLSKYIYLLHKNPVTTLRNITARLTVLVDIALWSQNMSKAVTLDVTSPIVVCSIIIIIIGHCTSS